MLIGISGLAGSGKDALGKFVSEMTTLPIVSLADPIKKFFVQAMLMNEEHTEGSAKEVVDQFYICTERAVAVSRELYGVDAVTAHDAFWLLLEAIEDDGIDFHESKHGFHITISPRRLFQLWGTDVWRNIGGDDFWIKQLPKNGICTDIRYDNEADAMDLNFRVQRQGHTSRAVAHASENGISLEKCVAVIHNNSDLASLERKAGTLVRTYCDSDLTIDNLFGELL